MNQLAQIPIGQTFGSPFGRGLGFADLVSIILRNALFISGIVLLILLVGGGIAMIAGAGQNNPETSAKGKKAASSALIGFAIIFVSYWLIQIIEIITGLSILNPPN